MENSDVVKEEVRVRLEKFEEVVGAIPKHQKTLSEIKAFLETLLPVVFDFPQQENKIEDLNSRFRRLTSIRKRIRTVGCSNDELEKVTKEENMGVDTLDDKNAIANASKTNLWKSFWCRNKNKSTTESPIWETDTFFDNLVLVRKKLELEIEVIEKTIFLNRALIEKSIVGKELVIFEMFLKKEHLRETLSSSEEFLLSLKKETSESFLISLETGRLELEERLESVSFGETALEEKKRNSFDKEKEIANSFSATEFKKLNEEKKELSEEIFSISKFIDETKQNLAENEKKSSVSLEVKKNINIDVLEKVYEECKKVKAGLEEEIGSFCYVFSGHSVFEMCRDFINRSFIKDASLLKEWLAMGKKATIVHIKGRNMTKDLMWKMWKEWNKKEDEIIKWFFTKECGSHGEYRNASITFAINEQVGMEINISM